MVLLWEYLITLIAGPNLTKRILTIVILFAHVNFEWNIVVHIEISIVRNSFYAWSFCGFHDRLFNPVIYGSLLLSIVSILRYNFDGILNFDTEDNIHFSKKKKFETYIGFFNTDLKTFFLMKRKLLRYSKTFIIGLRYNQNLYE